MTVSLGVVSRYANEVSTPESLVELADQALYEAKQSGRNRTKVMPRQKDEVGKVPELVRLVWNDTAESGHALLDEEHKMLFDQANQLLSAVVEGRPRPECRALLDQMLETIAGHFRDEAAILVTTSFPYLEHHLQCHKALLSEAFEMSGRFDRDELSIGELFGFLAYEVIARHILGEDRKFFPYLPTPDNEG